MTRDVITVQPWYTYHILKALGQTDKTFCASRDFHLPNMKNTVTIEAHASSTPWYRLAGAADRNTLKYFWLIRVATHVPILTRNFLTNFDFCFLRLLCCHSNRTKTWTKLSSEARAWWNWRRSWPNGWTSSKKKFPEASTLSPLPTSSNKTRRCRYVTCRHPVFQNI